MTESEPETERETKFGGLSFEEYYDAVLEYLFDDTTVFRAIVDFDIQDYQKFLDWCFKRYDCPEKVQEKLRQDERVKEYFDRKVAFAREVSLI